MAWRNLALEAKPRGVVCGLLSPGWVKTRMGGAGAEITPEESVGDMRALIDGLRRTTAAASSAATAPNCPGRLRSARLPLIGARFPDRWKTNGPAKRHAVAVG